MPPVCRYHHHHCHHPLLRLSSTPDSKTDLFHKSFPPVYCCYRVVSPITHGSSFNHFHHLHYHRLHLLLLAQYFILNSRLGSSANPFLHRPFPFQPDWFHGFSDHLMIFCSTAGFVWLSRLLVGFRTHFKSLHFHLIHSFIHSLWVQKFLAESFRICPKIYSDLSGNFRKFVKECFTLYVQL